MHLTEDDLNIKFDNGRRLPIMEEFYTIQGEGYNSGKAAYFIRIGGCDVGCHWCDVKESWNPELHPLVEVDIIIEHALQQPARAVVITGGEPSIYPLGYLTKKLKENDFETYIETSGTYPLTGIWDWICLSPKKTMKPLPSFYKDANELKVIIHNQHDFEWAEINRQRCLEEGNNCHFFLQPEWSKLEQNMPLIVNYIMLHPEWRVSLQTHKYMHIP